MQSGASLAGAVLVGSVAEQLLAATGSTSVAPAAPAAADFPDRLFDELATIVADLERKFPYASALFTSQGGVAITRDRNGKRVSESGFPTQGVSLRVFDGSGFHEAATGSTSPDALRKAAQGLIRDASVATQRYHIEPLTPHTETWRTPMERNPASLSLADRAALVDHEFDRCNWDDPRVRSARVTSEVGGVRRLFVDRSRRLASIQSTIQHSMQLFGFDKGRPGFGFKRRVGLGGLELAVITDAELEQMRREFVESFGTGQMPAGEYEVVFAPEVSGLLAHESFGHGVEMD